MDETAPKIVLEEIKKEPATTPAPPLYNFRPGANTGSTGYPSVYPGVVKRIDGHASWCSAPNGSGLIEGCDPGWCRPTATALPALPAPSTEEDQEVKGVIPIYAHPGIKHRAFAAHKDANTITYHCRHQGCRWVVAMMKNSNLEAVMDNAIIDKEPEIVLEAPTEISEFLRAVVEDMTNSGNFSTHDRKHVIWWWANEIRRRAIDAKLWRNTTL